MVREVAKEEVAKEEVVEVVQRVRHKPPVLLPQVQQVMPKVDDAEVRAVRVPVPVVLLATHQTLAAMKQVRAIHQQQHPQQHQQRPILLRRAKEPQEAKRLPLQARAKDELNDAAVAAVDSVEAVPLLLGPTEYFLRSMAKSTRRNFASSPIPICRS